MARRATATVQGTRTHTCSVCGAVFSCKVEATGAAQAGSIEEAQALAHQNAVKNVKGAFSQHPCPTCGAYQWEMVSQMALGWGCLGAIPLALAFLMALLGALDVLSSATVVYVLTLCMAVTFFLLVKTSRSDPNADVSRNLDLARTEVASGDLVLVTAGGAPRDEAVPHRRTPFFAWLGLAIQAGLLVASPAAELVCIGQPRNAAFDPSFVAPGDRARAYFPAEIRSLKGYWQGSVRATVKNAKELGLRNGKLDARTRGDQWGSFIGGKGSGPRTETLWADVMIPDDDALLGKRLELDLAIDVTYPASSGFLGFEEKTAHSSLTTTVELASSSGLGTLYSLLYRVFAVGGLVVFSILTALVTHSLAEAQGLMSKSDVILMAQRV